MVEKKHIGVLILIVLLGSIYIMLPEKVKIQVFSTNTKYYVWGGDKWNLGATETISLYNGSKKMLAKSRNLFFLSDNSTTKIIREVDYGDKILVRQEYFFNGSVTDVEKIPISNKLECYNCNGKILQYEFKDLEKINQEGDVSSPLLFGRIKIIWEDGAYFAKVYNLFLNNKLIIKYKPQEKYQVFKVLTIDPESLQDTTYKKFNKVVKENSDYYIEWSDTQGYGADRKFHLGGILKCKANDCNGIDIAIISPDRLNAGSQAVYYKYVNVTEITNHQFFCGSTKYGWVTPNSKLWCNTTISANMTNISHDIKETVEIIPPYDLKTTSKNATIFWNTSLTKETTQKQDITSKWDYKSFNTPYGSNIYYLKNINLAVGKDYSFELVLDVNETFLPLKYSVIVGDMATNSIYYFLDPTIINARTWSTNADFTNGTILSNLSSSDSGITIPSYISTTGLLWFASMDNADISGTTITSKVNGYTGTLTGTVTTGQTGVINEAISVAGAGYVNLKQQANSQIVGNWSVSAWVTTDDIDASLHNIVSLLDDLGNNNETFVLERYGANVRCHLVKNGGTMGIIATTTTPLVVGARPIFTTCVHTDGSLLQLFINGTQAINTSYTYGIGVTLGNMTVGVWSLVDGHVRYWSGKIDEVSVWNRVLSSSEISELYNSGAGLAFSNYNQGLYQDLQGWTPQTNKRINNITITWNNATTGTLQFRYNTTNASLGTSVYQSISNGTSTLNLVTSSGDTIYYDFLLNTAGTLVSYTIGEVAVDLAPTINSVTILPATPVDTDTNLQGFCNATDDISATVLYYWKWLNNGVVALTGGGTNSTKNIEVNLQNLTANNTIVGESWKFECLAGDGGQNGTALNSSAVLIIGQLNGTVVDVNSQIVADADVIIIDELSNLKVLNLTSNSSGLWWTNISVAGNYTAIASKKTNVSAGGAIKPHIEIK